MGAGERPSKSSAGTLRFVEGCGAVVATFPLTQPSGEEIGLDERVELADKKLSASEGVLESSLRSIVEAEPCGVVGPGVAARSEAVSANPVGIRQVTGVDDMAVIRAGAGFTTRVDAGVAVRVDAGLAVRVDAGVVVRVEAGLVVRVNAGVAVRVDAGVAARVDTGVSLRADAGAAVRVDTGGSVGADARVVVRVDTSVVVCIADRLGPLIANVYPSIAPSACRTPHSNQSKLTPRVRARCWSRTDGVILILDLRLCLDNAELVLQPS